MKTALLSLCIFLGFTAFGQITVTNETFPEAGDTLRVMTDITTENLNITSAGPDQTWDYTDISSFVVNENPIGLAEEGQYFDEFPAAELFIVLGLNVENYLDVTSTTYADLGFNGENEQTDFLDVTAKYTDPYILQRAPLNYQSQFDFSTTLLLPAAKEDLPDTLVENIPGNELLDSIRVRVEIEQTSEVDAYGTVMIPGAEYEVLRERRFEIRETFVDIKTTILPIWADISGQVEDLLPGLVGKDTIMTDHFFSATEKEPILVLTHDMGGNVTQAVYKYEGVVTSTSNISQSEPDFNAYPNPAIDKIKIRSKNIPDGIYTIRIFNILGKDLYVSRHELKQSGTDIKIDISHLNKGSYFYSIMDKVGKPIRTKRLLVIRP